MLEYNIVMFLKLYFIFAQMGIPLKSSENKYILVQKDVLEAL